MYVIKRVLDLIFSIILLNLLIPLFVVIAISIKTTSKGPVIFKQKRLGINGKVFTIYKFRTMIENAEHIGRGIFIDKNDDRITKIGRFLRTMSLDELPQLINIIKGDMSFVGPRPPLIYYPYVYDQYNNRQKIRFTILPGITGYAQIKGRSQLSWKEKIDFDVNYVENYSLWLDIKIIAITLYKVIRREKIFEK